LFNTSENTIIREATVHHSITGEFSVRKGDWKLLLSPSSGGWSYPRPGRDTAIIHTLPKIQLYNIASDPTESKNIYAEHPEVVNDLQTLLIKYIKEGRSTPGIPQENEAYPWKQLDGLD
ncbi:MAG: arylsulfatase, partial [Tannerella sp.]|nr:arylsulfatase [Tannerella sp.]